MPRLRFRFTLRAIMIAVLLVSIVLAIFVYRQRARLRNALNQALATHLRLQQELGVANGDVALAESDLQRAEDRVAWAGRMFTRGVLSEAQYSSNSLELQKAQFVLAQAKTKRSVLLNFGNLKNLKSLEEEIEKLRAQLEVMGGSP